MLSFAVTSADGSVQRLPVAVHKLVIAGMTGRDKAKVQEHLDELAELGISGPSTIPIYYPLSASLVTQADAITVVGHDSSGEVEAMVIGTLKGMLVTVASDHTDRKAEAYSIHLSKQLCAKPIAASAWWYADVADRWDLLTLRADQDGELYQEGNCTAMLPPVEPPSPTPTITPDVESEVGGVGESTNDAGTELARTGASAGPIAAIGGVLLAFGTALQATARRFERRHRG